MPNKVFSPISIDLGAISTGLYLYHEQQGIIEKEGHTIINDSSVTWSMANRTAVRHHQRNLKRRKMAKRLLFLLLNANLDKAQAELLSGLLNRRGFTFLSEGSDSLKDIDEYVLNIITEDLQKLEGLTPDDIATNHELFSKELSSEAFGQIIKEHKDIKNELISCKKAILNTCEEISRESEGHKPRKQYLKDIKEDILADTRYHSIASENNISVEELANIVGHISNLQLRVLRKYFNDESLKSLKVFDDAKLHKIFYKWLSSWSCKGDSTEAQGRKLLRAHRDKSIYQVFKEIDPIYSIPPYENMANRNLDKDRTLFINPAKLTDIFPDYEAAVTKLVAADNSYIESKAVEISEESRRHTGLHLSRESIILQRFLDRSMITDTFCLRRLAEENGIDKNPDGFANLLKIIGSKPQAERLIKTAAQYYKEVGKAKRGLYAEKGSLLSPINAKTPRKNKTAHDSISAVIGSELSQSSLESLKELMKEKIGRKSIKGIVTDAAKAQKDHGNKLKHIIEKAEWKYANGHNIDKDEKSLMMLLENVKKSADVIAEKFNADPERFNNVFSFAQIANILFTDQKGYSKSAKCVIMENGWRSQLREATDKHGEVVYVANASRLPVDSVRPFDGMLDKIIKRLAYEIAELKIKQIQSHNLKGAVHIPIIIEENRFSFTMDMYSIKKMKKKQNTAKDKLIKQEKHFQDKFHRIVNASKGICPYTGKPIGSSGDIDHILPRAKSRKSGSQVFNSEANLIYCSTEGNRKKADMVYTLEDLSENYLNALYPNMDKNMIVKCISETISKHSNTVYYTELTEDEQRDFRHALFIPELSSKVYPLLHTRSKTMVNGTQAWLCKNLKSTLEKNLASAGITPEIEIIKVNSEDISELRKMLAVQDNRFAKPADATQSPVSHIADAAMAFAYCLRAGVLPIGDFEQLTEYLPKNYSVKKIAPKPIYADSKNPASKKIFNDTIYGINFLPVLLFKDGSISNGFSKNNCVPVKTKDYLELMKPFLRYKGKNISANFEEIAKNSPMEFALFTIDTDTAMKLMHKTAKEPVSELELTQTSELNRLFYTTVKSNIRSTLWDANGKYKGIPHEKKLKNAGITLPLAKEWQKLCNYIETMGISTDNKLDNNTYDGIISACGLFDRQPDTRKHSKERKIYSLPITGEGTIAIRQFTPNGSTVWQIKKAAKVVNEGFTVDKKGKWREVSFSHFRNSPNVFIVGEKFAEYKSILKFGMVRKVDLGIADTSTYMKLAEKTRVDICLLLSADKFTSEILPFIDTDIKDVMLLPDKLMLNCKHLLEIFQPRDGKIELIKIGPEISILFRNTGFGAPLKNAFIKGDDVDEAYSPF